MPYITDHTVAVEIDLHGNGTIEVDATFSVYSPSHDGDYHSLTLETIQLGEYKMPREQVIMWVGKAEVLRLEDIEEVVYTPYEEARE